jgi:hypothetical protein
VVEELVAQRGDAVVAAQRSRTRAGVRKQVPELTSVVPPTARPSGRTIGGVPMVAS